MFKRILGPGNRSAAPPEEHPTPPEPQRINKRAAGTPRRSRQRIGLLGFALVTGALLGLFVLRPVNDFVAWYEHEVNAASPVDYVLGELAGSLNGAKPRKSALYAVVGALIGLLSATFYVSVHERNRRIGELAAELEKDLDALIGGGESDRLEFKSTFRWDLREQRTNRALEAVIMKSLAGFLNGRGGTLLIGVADDGEIVGLEPDYRTLKKPDRDGFEQALMTAVAVHCGGDLAPFLRIMFHSVHGREVCRVMIAPAPRPVYLEQSGAPKLYLRSGATTRELNVKEAMDYQANRWPA